MIKKTMLFILMAVLVLSVYVNAEEVMVAEENAVEERENLALNKEVTASVEQTGNIGANLTDGDEVSYWASNVAGSSAVVDLGDLFYVDTVEFVPHGGRAYEYRVSVSCDSVNYVDVVVEENPESVAVVSREIYPVEARYVKLTISGMPAGVSWINIKEMRVYGECRGSDLYYGEDGQGLSVNIAGGKITGAFTGVSSSVWGRKMTLVVAVFNGNRMIAYNAETSAIPTYGTEFTKTVSIDDSTIDLNGKIVEVFVWDDLENMKTLVPPVSVTVGTTE